MLFILSGAFLALCLVAALTDISSLKIPNWLNGLIILLFVPAIIIASPGWAVAGAHILIGVCALVLGYLLFALGILGGGDAKFVPGVMLWIGPGGAITFLMYMALSGGLLALVAMMGRKHVPAAFVPGPIRPMFEPKAGIPYGVAICVGAMCATPLSPLTSEIAGVFGWGN